MSYVGFVVTFGESWQEKYCRPQLPGVKNVPFLKLQNN